MEKRSLRILSVICIIIDLITIIAILILRRNLPPIIPLFYGLPVSESELAPNIGLIISPVISGLSVILNFGLNRLLKDPFLAQILTGVTITLTALSLISVVKIILLV